MLAMLDQELTAVWTLDIGDVDDDLPIIYRPTALDVDTTRPAGCCLPVVQRAQPTLFDTCCNRACRFELVQCCSMSTITKLIRTNI